VNGVREKLREEFKRSPDPDEMEYELSRDKGFGGLSKNKNPDGVEEEESTERTSEEDSMGSHSESPLTDQSEKDDGECGPSNLQQISANKVHSNEQGIYTKNSCAVAVNSLEGTG
jgi:hypothetical protein